MSVKTEIAGLTASIHDANATAQGILSDFPEIEKIYSLVSPTLR